MRADAIVIGTYALAALFITSSLWRRPTGRYIPVTDQFGFEWTIAAVTKSILEGQNPFFTDLINVPFGINVMAQTSIIGLIVPLIPVTLLFGPQVTFLVLLTGSLAGTAAAWYWVLSRHLVRSRLAAAIAGAFLGFAPPMVSHASGGHINYVAQFVLPFIAWQVLRLATDRRWLRNGVILGVLIAWQVLIGEEPLLVLALALGVYTVAYALLDRRAVRAMVRPFLSGLGVAAGVASALVAYPLWHQFFGPQSYGPIAHVATLGNDVFSLTTFASQSIGGLHHVGHLAYNPTEENGFFGWPLLALTAVCAIWLWRSSAIARAATVTAVLFLGLSLGQELVINGRDTGIPLPWRVLQHIPLVGSILPSRLVFAAMPAIAVLLALAIDRLQSLAPAAERTGVPVRLLWIGAVVAVLLPIVPSRLDVYERPAVPEFFSAGTWREYADPGSTIVIVPPPGAENYQASWQVAADLEFRQIEGYFIGPHGDDRHGWYGVADQRPTSKLLAEVASTGEVPEIGERERRQLREDLTFWSADAVVLNPATPNADELRAALEALLGPGTFVDGVWAWDVRDEVDR